MSGNLFIFRNRNWPQYSATLSSRPILALWFSSRFVPERVDSSTRWMQIQNRTAHEPGIFSPSQFCFRIFAYLD